MPRPAAMPGAPWRGHSAQYCLLSTCREHLEPIPCNRQFVVHSPTGCHSTCRPPCLTDAIPSGLSPPARGWPNGMRPTPGIGGENIEPRSGSVRCRQAGIARVATPLGLRCIAQRRPRVARAAQPWAQGCNAFGVKETRSIQIPLIMGRRVAFPARRPAGQHLCFQVLSKQYWAFCPEPSFPDQTSPGCGVVFLHAGQATGGQGNRWRGLGTRQPRNKSDGGAE